MYRKSWTKPKAHSTRCSPKSKENVSKRIPFIIKGNVIHRELEINDCVFKQNKDTSMKKVKFIDDGIAVIRRSRN